MVTGNQLRAYAREPTEQKGATLPKSKGPPGWPLQNRGRNERNHGQRRSHCRDHDGVIREAKAEFSPATAAPILPLPLKKEFILCRPYFQPTDLISRLHSRRGGFVAGKRVDQVEVRLFHSAP